MIRSSFVAALASLLCVALAATSIQGCTTAPAQATALDHPAVARYVAGWKAHDGAQVASAFVPGGLYRDPSLPGAVDAAQHIAAHVATLTEARFELQSSRRLAPDQVELQWTAVWPKRAAAFDFVDVLTLDGAAIQKVESHGPPPPEAARLVAAYEVLHDAPNAERMQALLAKDVEVYGTTLPPSGLRYDSYPGFLEKLRGTAFRQQPDAPLAITKDGRIVMRWTLTGGGKRLAAGVDYLTVEQGRIRKIVGVY